MKLCAVWCRVFLIWGLELRNMENERKIEVEFESTEKDFQRVLLWYHWKRMFFAYLLMIIAGIPLCYFLGFNVLDIKNNGWATLAFFGTLSILLLLDIYRRCFFPTNKLKERVSPTKIVFSEQEVESKTPSTFSSRNWEGYEKIYETNSDFIFFYQENVFYSIPKRFFNNESQIIELRQLIGEKLGEKAKLQTNL